MVRKFFVDREAELGRLENAWREKGFSLVFVYGRRRIGKTRLLSEFSKGKPGVHYIAVEAPYEAICREFSECVKRSLGMPFSGDVVEVIEAASKMHEGKLLMVLDEFQYIAEANPAVPSRLQRLIDLSLSERNLMLVLCGSAVSFFEEKLLGYKSPLFGRRALTIRLKPLSLPQIKGFFPEYSFEELFKVYAVVGGTPAYLEKLSGERSFEENLRIAVSPGSYLYDEALNLLRQEVREPRTYLAILSSVAEGRNAQNEVASAAHVDPRIVGKYVDLLEELDILEKVKPLGYKRPVTLEFKDNYFRFWFTYTYKLRSLLEAGYIEEAVSHILETFDNYLSKVFERTLLELTPALHASGLLPVRPVEAGRWWHKDAEIDVVVRDPGKSAAFIEAKWSNLTSRDAERLLKELEEKAPKTGLTAPENHFIIAAKKILDAETPLELDEHRKVVDLEAIGRALRLQ